MSDCWVVIELLWFMTPQYLPLMWTTSFSWNLGLPFFNATLKKYFPSTCRKEYYFVFCSLMIVISIIWMRIVCHLNLAVMIAAFCEPSDFIFNCCGWVWLFFLILIQREKTSTRCVFATSVQSVWINFMCIFSMICCMEIFTLEAVQILINVAIQ